MEDINDTFDTEMSSVASVDDGFCWVGQTEDITTNAPQSPQHMSKQEVMIVVVMELCEGINLRKWLSKHRGHIQKSEAIAVFAALAKSVREMHANGIVHRDIKPENIFISNVNGEFRVQIIDFDLALVSDQPVGSDSRYFARAPQTSTDSVLVGTPWYAAPEACSKIALEESTELHHLAQLDLFPLAVIFMEMLLPHDTLMGRHKAIDQYRLSGHVPLAVRRECPEMVPILRRLKSGITADQLCHSLEFMRQSVLSEIPEM
jgi:serine/threonine protein kinase